MRNPLRHHNKNHPPSVPFDVCQICARDKAICRSKIRFASWQEASEWVEDFNVSHEYANPVARYRCRCCEGWHLKTARDPRALWRAEKARRKWLIRRSQLPEHGTPAG